MTRPVYTSPCTDASEQHTWAVDPEGSDFVTMRYVCKCGARAWRERATRARTTNAPIREYAPDSKRSGKQRTDVLKPSKVTRWDRRVGNNTTGGYLPPGSGGRR